MTFLTFHWLDMDQMCKLTSLGRGKRSYYDWLGLTQILLSKPLILGPAGGP